MVLYGLVIARSVSVAREEQQPVRFRLLVGCLHVAQPLWRTWGRLRARPLDPLVAGSNWTGEREMWLSRVRNEFVRRGCAVRGGNPDECWDLHATVGPLLVSRVATAVVWNWYPQYRAILRPRRAFFFATAVAVALLLTRVIAGECFTAAVLLVLAGETYVLRRATRRALRVTMPATEVP
jgi:hypothetical protein